MCAICGCADTGDGHAHPHGHDDRDGHAHPPRRRIALEHDVLAANREFASANRAMLRREGVAAINLVSSPGSGKTALLERTIRELDRGWIPVVIEGDQRTSRDADRIAAAGGRAIQINTGKGCHLDAHMVGHALERLAVAPGELVVIENVGNLVCPTDFDLGETARVVMLSLPEGEDKPLKYPGIFASAQLVLISKLDLLPHLAIDLDGLIANARQINPGIEVIALSARTGEGMARWYAWLTAHAAAARRGRAAGP